MSKHHARIVALLAGVGFVSLALVVVHFPQEVAGLDASAVALVQPLQTLFDTHIFYAISFLGGVYGITLAAFCLLLFPRRLELGLPIAFGLAASALSANLIKMLVERARPVPLQWLAPLHSYSFPSGHATSIMVLYGGLALYFLSHIKKRPIRIAAVTLASIMVALVGFSRVVLGYHYLSDVIGGYLLGVFWIGAVQAAMPKHLSAVHRQPYTQDAIEERVTS